MNLTWREILIEAMKDPQELKKMSALARQPRNYQVPQWDYKKVQSEGREDEVE